MILMAFAVRDNAVEAFSPPFFVRTKNEALRSFVEAVADDKQAVSRHAQDYSLYHVGSFDDGSGMFRPQEPVILLSALQAKQQLESPQPT